MFKTTPQKGVTEIKRCLRCNRFLTDKEAAEAYFYKIKVVELFDVIGIVAFESDRIEGT